MDREEILNLLKEGKIGLDELDQPFRNDREIVLEAVKNGASLKASNFKYDGIAGGTHWTGKRNRGQAIPKEKKQRWIYEIDRRVKQ